MATTRALCPISLSLCVNESGIMLSSVHREASSVGLKGPEAEVAQLFLWLFKDNLHWEPWSRLSLSATPISCGRLLSEIARVFISAHDIFCVHFFFSSHAHML